MPIASVALGVKVIEKHFTTDKKMKGWDHHMSIDAEDLSLISKGTKRVFEALEALKYIELSSKKSGLFSKKRCGSSKYPKEEIITEEMLDVKRPGTGLPPDQLKILLEKKQRDITRRTIKKKISDVAIIPARKGSKGLKNKNNHRFQNYL